MQAIERGIFYEEAYLGVTVGGLVYSHGTVMIDSPLRMEDARSWRSALLNQRGGSNRILVTLDGHPDRTLGARAMDCSIIAQQKTAQVFRNRPTIFKGQNISTGATWETYDEALGMRWTPPDITFSQRMSLHWGGPEIVLEHHPGPTAGSCWVIVPDEKVLFVGDTVVVQQPVFLAHADLDVWIDSLNVLLEDFGEFTIIAGRGGIAQKKVVSALQQGLKKVMAEIDRLAKRNAPPEATEELIPALLSEIKFDNELHDHYMNRLRYGLFQYYARHFRPASSLEQPEIEENEE
jgi:glyoxylase-like metal-dependent hydrolase (beta-lactamase superfamily II)